MKSTTQNIKDGRSVMTAFFNAWKKGDTSAMFELATETFRGLYDLDTFEKMFHEAYTLEKFEYRSVTCGLPVVLDFVYDLTQNGKKRRLKVRLVKEKAPYTPAEDGKWGIYPPSFQSI